MTWRYAAYALAYELGYIDVDAMLASISIRQLMEWHEFTRIRSDELSGKGKAASASDPEDMRIQLLAVAKAQRMQGKGQRHAHP